MLPNRGIKTDIVIGMTLAEIFLLILFVVWYQQGAGSGPEWEKIAKERQEQIANLREQLKDKQGKILELEKIRDWWRQNFGVNPPTSLDELKEALQPQGLTIAKMDPSGQGSKNAGRSNLTPKCSELGLKDILFNAVIRGRQSYEVNGETRSLQELLSAYSPELSQAEKQRCRYSVNVSYQPDVTTDDFVFALRRLRSEFYVQLPE